ncbi:glycosyltransferase [Roseomonas eburnea]|uniref:Glycosyltransferase n=1 Tax=Neoroseomonas eburnea TaxID=1346889 RepID=A0A9X9XC71_9PROT|nr:glycosyltransferase [Neoroseomonas eburnea]MBR0681307.1 glycosyltransferase [Neoroseomonas eburnea]
MREDGDRHRDAKRWEAAASSYRAYLAVMPTDWPIIVQLGHCVKEAGGQEEALRLYRRAEILAPDNPDLKVQIGHALKLLGRSAEAVASYNAALRIDPEYEDAERELLAVWASIPLADAEHPAHDADATIPNPRPQDIAIEAEGVAEAGPPPAVLLPDWDGPVPELAPPDPLLPDLLLDISDLVAHLTEARRPTGLQRVQIEVVRAALSAPDPRVVAVLAFRPESGAWHWLATDLFEALVRHFEAPETSDAPMGGQGLLDAIRAAPMATLRPGQVLVMLGACWALPGHALAVARARQAGLRYIPFVHDCIPLLYPELCNPGTVRDFAGWFSTLGAGADGFLVNSRATAADLRRFQARLFGALPQPVEIVHLDAARRRSGSTGNSPIVVGQREIGRPFVLAVGTFEPRKDHATLLDAWRDIATTASGPIPLLVCVGRRGWGDFAAIEAQIADPALAPHVVLLHDVSEAELDALYDGCLFTVCTSRHEGWGLPVTESIAHGRVPVVPAHSGLLEAGAGCAAFYEPGDFGRLRDVLARLCFDTAHRGALELTLLRNRRLRSWHEVAQQILAAAARVSMEPPRPPIPMLRTGHFAALNGIDRQVPSLAAALPALACATAGWGLPCEHGVPFTRPGAVLHLTIAVDEMEADSPCRLHIGLRGGLAAQAVTATLTTEAMASSPLSIPVRFHPGSLSSACFERSWSAGTHRVAISLAVDTLESGGDGSPAGWFVGVAFSGGGRLLTSRSFRDRLALAGTHPAEAV